MNMISFLSTLRLPLKVYWLVVLCWYTATTTEGVSLPVLVLYESITVPVLMLDALAIPLLGSDTCALP